MNHYSKKPTSLQEKAWVNPSETSHRNIIGNIDLLPENEIQQHQHFRAVKEIMIPVDINHENNKESIHS